MQISRLAVFDAVPRNVKQPVLSLLSTATPERTYITLGSTLRRSPKAVLALHLNPLSGSIPLHRAGNVVEP